MSESGRVRSRPGTASSTEAPVPSPSLPPPPPQRNLLLEISANLANLLPTGTLLVFHLLIPLFTTTNNGNSGCDSVTRSLTLLFLFLLTASCFLACFTDTVSVSTTVGGERRVYYGIATLSGMWLFDYPPDYYESQSQQLPDLRKYRMRALDFIHAFLSVCVFGAVAFRDTNVVTCLYPHPDHNTQELLNLLPTAVGVLCSLLFVSFPTRRHGIGYPIHPMQQQINE